MMRDRTNITIAIRYEVMYSSSIDAVANIVRPDLDFHFQGHEFWNVKTWKRREQAKNGESQRKMLKCYVDRGWYLASNRTIASIVLHDINLYFQGQTFQVFLFTSKCWKIQTLLLPLDRKSGICIEWHHFECCASWVWPTFSWSWI